MMLDVRADAGRISVITGVRSNERFIGLATPQILPWHLTSFSPTHNEMGAASTIVPRFTRSAVSKGQQDRSRKPQFPP